MSGLIIALLLILAYALLAQSNPRPTMTAEPRPVAALRRKLRMRLEPDGHELPLFVHQLAALLQSGRNQHSLWEDALSVYRATRTTDLSHGRRLANSVVPVLEQAAQAASLGISPSHALTNAAVDCNQRKQARLAGLWTDLAACLEVSERCGAPLGAILARYAVQLEARLDGEAARDTALAGPKATVRILTWLPVFGLGLGFVMGMNPLAVLLGTPAGWAFLLAGTALMFVGRWWSGKLVAAASRDGLA